MSRTQRVILLVTFVLALFAVSGLGVQTDAKQLHVNTAQMQTSQSPVDYCCLNGLACCKPKTE